MLHLRINMKINAEIRNKTIFYLLSNRFPVLLKLIGVCFCCVQPKEYQLAHWYSENSFLTKRQAIFEDRSDLIQMRVV